MINDYIPAVKKINKPAVAVVVLVLLGGYVVFGFKNLGKKHDFKALGYNENQEYETELDAPRFVQGRTYSEMNFLEVPPPSVKEEIKDSPGVVTSVYHEDVERLGVTPVVVEEPVPDIQPKPKDEAGPQATPGGIDHQITHGGGAVVDEESIKNNSPSGWGGAGFTQGGMEGIVDYANYSVPDLNLPGTEKLIAALGSQGQKPDSRKAFMESVSAHEDVYLQETIETPKSPYQIMAGSVIPCTMVSGINSDLPGDIIAQVRGPVYDSTTGHHLLIPHGTKFIGSYDSGVVFGQKRCLFAWKRLIFPDGRSIQLRGMRGTDLAGYSGIKDSVDYHYMRLTGAILMSSFMAIGTERLDNGNTFRSQMAEDINKSGQKIVDMQLNVQPTLKIAPATPFNIMVNKDIVLKPYKG